MRSGIVLLLAVVFLLAAPAARGQEPACAGAECPRIEISGSYSLLRNDENVHGVQTAATVRLSPRWAGRFSRIAWNKDGSTAQFLLAGAEYRFSGGFIPRTEQVDTSRLEFFVVAQAGFVRQNGAASGAYSVGGGVDFRVNDNLAVRMASVDYLRGRIDGPGGAQRNRAVIASGLNLRF